MKWRLVITPQVQSALYNFPPETKRYIRQAFRELCQEPKSGKPLRDELTGFRSFRVKRFRVVYQIQSAIHRVVIIGVGRRETIYDQLTKDLKTHKLQ